jgi:hypothetical protein
MLHPDLAGSADDAIPIKLVTPETWPGVAAALDPLARGFAATSGFEPKDGRILALPALDGAIASVLFATEPEGDPFAAGRLATGLPPELTGSKLRRRTQRSRPSPSSSAGTGSSGIANGPRPLSGSCPPRASTPRR